MLCFAISNLECLDETFCNRLAVGSPRVCWGYNSDLWTHISPNLFLSRPIASPLINPLSHLPVELFQMLRIWGTRGNQLNLITDQPLFRVKMAILKGSVQIHAYLRTQPPSYPCCVLCELKDKWYWYCVNIVNSTKVVVLQSPLHKWIGQSLTIISYRRYTSKYNG